MDMVTHITKVFVSITILFLLCSTVQQLLTNSWVATKYAYCHTSRLVNWSVMSDTSSDTTTALYSFLSYDEK